MAWIYKPKYQRKNNQKRKERQEIYQSPLWKKLRLAKLRDCPICEVCEMEGIIKLAEDCHHLKSFLNSNDEVERDNLAFDFDNLLSVDKICHSRLHNGDLKGCITKEDIRNKIDENKRK